MLHAFVGEDDAAVRRTVKAPMLRYLGSSANLVGAYTKSVPFFQQRCEVSTAGLTADDVRRVEAAGADAVLVGEALMREPDVGRALARLRGTS